MHVVLTPLLSLLSLLSVPPAAEPPPPGSAPASSSSPSSPEVLTSGPSSSDAAVTRVLVMDLKAAGVDAVVVAQATAAVAWAIDGHPGHAALTGDDVRDLAGHLKERAMTGCEEASCLADLSRGMNADLVVHGSVGVVGSAFTVSLTVVDARASSVKDRGSVSVGQRGRVAEAARDLVQRLLGLGGATVTRFRLADGQRTSFAVLDLTAAGVSEQAAVNLTQVLSSEIRRVEGTTVVSRDDIRAMLQMQEDKDRLGCAEASCLAEIGGALGVERLVAGSVGKLADSYVVSLRLIAVQGSRVENRVMETFSGSEDQLMGAVRHAGRRLVGIEPAEPGSVSVGSTEKGAELLVDEQRRGTIPQPPVGGLPAGKHALRVARSGFYDWVGDVYVDPAETTTVWVGLKARPVPWYKKWWVWTIIGGVGLSGTVAVLAVAGTGVAGTVGAVRLVTYPSPETSSGSVTVGK